MREEEPTLLHRLARLYGVEPAYRDVTGRDQEATPDSLLAVLRALGAPLESLDDLPNALRERTQKQWQRCCEPVTVAWEGKPVHLEVRLPAEWADITAGCWLELENGEVQQFVCNLSRLPVIQTKLVEGVNYTVRQLVLPYRLPWGYHHLTLNLPEGPYETLIISAPLQVHTLPDGEEGRIWGIFLPLYALYSSRSWGAGDFTDLEALTRWVQRLGGNFVGTLPLLATFLEEPFDPSPYAPVSRLFWNEFYLDVSRIEETKRCQAAQELLTSSDFQQEMADLRAAPLVDYRQVMRAKRKILEHLARYCHAENSGRHESLCRWVEENPAIQDYARFRATVEQCRASWPQWPDRMRNGILREGDYNPENEFYHLYVQWLADEQIQHLSGQARQQGQGLYLDFPLGIHRAGYDVWRERASFALEASSGAPPDAFFSQGQDWGFPPLHPERIRKQGYRYYIACLRHHLRHAGILRLDHVMGLHHLFWIPRGLPAREGVYVRYHAEEFYAILALESQRHQTLVVGEDLGTVPEYVRTTMAQHKVYRMYILPFECTQDLQKAPCPLPADVLASLNTHDMPTFASFWLQKKEDKLSNGIPLSVFPDTQEFPVHKIRSALRTCLAHLAAGQARILLVNLEDLWLETAPQNVPGSRDEYPNWRRKARYPLEAFAQMPEVLEILQEINRLRKS